MRHLIRVMRGYDLTNKKAMTKINTKTKKMTKTTTETKTETKCLKYPAYAIFLKS